MKVIYYCVWLICINTAFLLSSLYMMSSHTVYIHVKLSLDGVFNFGFNFIPSLLLTLSNSFNTHVISP